MFSQSILFLSTRSSLVSLKPHDVTGTLSADRGGVRVDCKLEQLIVQLRQDARFKPASLLRHIRHAKSAFGNPNVRFTKLAPLKPHSPDAKAKLAYLVKYKSALLGMGPSSPAIFKRLCPDAIISNVRAASLISRDAKLTLRSRDARAVFMRPASLNPASQLYKARMPPDLDIARLISLILLPRI